MRRAKPLAERLEAHSVVDEHGCRVWMAQRNHGGYGVIGMFEEGRPIPRLAHRVAYEHFVGPIPEGMELDHLCRVRACIAIEHLDLVTGLENRRRQRRPLAERDRCSKGHPYTEENTYLRHRGNWVARVCRTCQVEANRAYRKRRVSRVGQ